MSLKKILVLPNYNQIDQIPVLVQENSEAPWKISNYVNEIPKGSLPKGVDRGIPHKILEKNNREGFVLGRLVRKDNPVLFLACQAGQDKTDRYVFLTLIASGEIQSLKDPHLQISKDALTPLKNDPNSLVPQEKIIDLEKAISTLNQCGDQKSQGQLAEMWHRFETEKHYTWFASVPLKGASFYIPDSEEAGGEKDFDFLELIKLIKQHKKKVISSSIVLMFLVLMIYHSHQKKIQQQNQDQKQAQIQQNQDQNHQSPIK